MSAPGTPVPEPPAGVDERPPWLVTGIAAVRAIPVVWLLLIVVFAWIAWQDENFLTPEGFLAYLKTSAPLAILAKAAEWMGVGLFERRAQHHRLPPPILPECAMRARIGKQGEGLVVEIEARIADPAVKIDG